MNRFNDQHSEEELSRKGVSQEVLVSVALSGWLTDVKMVLDVFLPISLNAGHGRIGAIDSHPWMVHKCRVFYLKCSGLCVDIHRDGFCLRAVIFFTFTVSF